MDKMSNNYINIICYADGALLFADSENNLQRILHKSVTAAREYDVLVPTDKTNESS